MKNMGHPATILTLLLDAAYLLVSVEVCVGGRRP